MAKIPFFNPKGARYVPVSISAIETYADGTDTFTKIWDDRSTYTYS